MGAFNPKNIPPQPQPQAQQPGANNTVLVFLKSLAAPIVLYTDNPVTLYEELKKIMQQANPQAPKVIEKPGAGPLKKISFLDTQLAGMAIQNELPSQAPRA